MAANVTVVLSGDEKRLLDALDRVVSRQLKLRDAARETGETTERAGRGSVNVLDQVAGKVSDVVTRFGPWAAALGAVAKGYETLLQLQERVAQRQREAGQWVGQAGAGLASLAQFSEGDPAKFASLTAAARRAYGRGVGGSLEEAARFVGEYEAAGVVGEGGIDTMTRLYPIFGAESAKIVQGAAAMQKALGVRETGDLQSLVAKGLVAARVAPGGIPEAMLGAAKSAAPAGMLGISDEELFASFATVAGAVGSAEEGGTAMSSLLTAFARKNLRGSMLDNVERLAKRRMSPKRLATYLGDVRAAKAFNALAQGLEPTRELMAEIGAADPSSIEGHVGVLQQDPIVTAARHARIARGVEELTAERMGAIDARAQAIIQEREAELRRAGSPEWLTQAATWAAERERKGEHSWWEYPGLAVRRAVEIPGRWLGFGGSVTDEAERDVANQERAQREALEAARRTAESNERMALDSLNRGLVDVPGGRERQGGR